MSDPDGFSDFMQTLRNVSNQTPTSPPVKAGLPSAQPEEKAPDSAVCEVDLNRPTVLGELGEDTVDLDLTKLQLEQRFEALLAQIPPNLAVGLRTLVQGGTDISDAMELAQGIVAKSQAAPVDIMEVDVGEGIQENVRLPSEEEKAKFESMYGHIFPTDSNARQQIQDGTLVLWIWKNGEAFILGDAEKKCAEDIHPTAYLENYLVIGPSNIGEHAILRGGAQQGSVLFNSDVGRGVIIRGGFAVKDSKIEDGAQMYATGDRWRVLDDCVVRQKTKMCLMPEGSGHRTATIRSNRKGEEQVVNVPVVEGDTFERQRFASSIARDGVPTVSVSTRAMRTEQEIAAAINRSLQAPTVVIPNGGHGTEL